MNGLTSPRRNRPARLSTARTLGWFAAASLVFAAVAPSAAAANPNANTICHATASDSNPYVKNTPATAGQLAGHADHTGPIWTPGATSWGDIIPPISDLLPDGLNWTAEGQAWLANGCQAPTTQNTGGDNTGDTGGSGGDTSGSGDNSGSGDQQSGDNTGDISGSGDQGTIGGDNTGDNSNAGDNTGGQGDTGDGTSNAGDNSNAGANTGGSTVSPVVVPVQPVDQPAAIVAPEGGVAGVVSAPRPTPRPTLPPTDTLSSIPAGSAPIPAWRLILIGLAALIASLLLMSDRTARRRS